MNIQIPTLDNVRKDIRAKISESYAATSRKIEEGIIDPLYPENPAQDATAIAAATPDKPLTVNSELLRDLLNWAKQADPAAIDNAVAKAEELAAAGPMGPEKLIDITGSADYQQPGQMTPATIPPVPGNEVPAVGSEATPGMPVATGPVGPLSPVMASVIRRGKQMAEAKAKQMKEDDIIAVDADKEAITNVDQMKKPAGKGGTSGLPLGDKKNKGNTGVLENDIIPGTSNEPILNTGEMHTGKNPEAAGPTPRWTAKPKVAREDDVIPGVAHEPIVNPAEMGKKNPGVKPEGGQVPTGLPLNDPMNKGDNGIEEAGLDDGQAAEVSQELDQEAGAELPGAGIPGNAGEIPPGQDLMLGGELDAAGPEAIAPAMDAGAELAGAVTGALGAAPAAPAASGGIVQQIQDMKAKLAELEAVLMGGAGAAPAIPAIGSEAPEIGGDSDIDDIDDIDDIEKDGEESEEGAEGAEEKGEDSEAGEAEEAGEKAGEAEEEAGEEAGEKEDSDEGKEKGGNPFAKK